MNGWRRLSGPNFVRKNGIFQALVSEKIDLKHDDPEVKRAVVHKAYSKNSRENDWDVDRLNHVSSWYRALRIIALCLQLKDRWRRKEIKGTNLSNTPSKRPLPQLV